ncbi:hypothetical protein ASE12_02795 [Aeromicrobium sp. Root236]|uniref:class F sortase n=1 Tax=Aeromicrobium sp. Root236 TaxID=1736498 RepID=UPI0006F52285|nr:class F sortase [Aeromicrobium sp. Root236]KRC63787.1 hypothetical protein ASE12_02795 [Aeromicrobium sp. Root236]
MTTAEHRSASPKGLVVVLVVVALVAAAGVAWLLRPDDTTGRPFAMGSPVLQPVAVPSGTCARPATTPFTPTSVTIPHVVKDGQVLALPRDSRNVPGVPPTSAKFTFAWDRPGIKPGSERGNVLLNAHTWPDGSAVGNVMLDKLHEGDRIILRGGRSELCYTVSKRIEVLASKGYAPYYARDGLPQVALIVCSGKRLGPGEWTHRTIWFADPAA